VLFAPDLVHGATTVLDLRRLAVGERLDGVTMPHFGPWTDRYAVVAGDVLLVSYPERAPIARVPADLADPWQVVVSPEGGVLFVLERRPDGAGEAVLVAIDLTHRQVSYRAALGGDVGRVALSAPHGLLALANRSARRLDLVSPARGETLLAVDLGATPMDLVLVGEEPQAVVATRRDDGGGELLLWQLKANEKKGWFVKRSRQVPLRAGGLRLAVSPDGQFVAVALTDGSVPVVDLKTAAVVATVTLPGEPRDLVWCDPSRPGPTLPEWTDGAPPEIDLGPPGRR
jgi:hypothetical protein